jgi:hypothetical protein
MLRIRPGIDQAEVLSFTMPWLLRDCLACSLARTSASADISY